jgi:hypothetical protein
VTQYTTVTNDFLNTNRNIYEVMYLANGANGNIVSTENPLPVTLGSESITIQGNISIPTSVEISNDVGNPIPVTGNVNANVTGSVTIDNDSIEVTGNVNANVTGSVTIDNDSIEVTQGTDPWVIQGNVVVTSIPEVEIKNDVGNPITIQIVESGSVISPENALSVRLGDSPTTSAFGRLRVAGTRLLGEFRTKYGTYGPIEMLTVKSGSGNTIVDLSNTLTYLTTTTASGDRVLRQSRKYHPYIPGTTQYGLISFCFGEAKSNVQQMVGMFDDKDGVFLRMNGTTPEFVIRKANTDVEVVPQSEWNIDKFDGSDIDNLLLDFTKAQVLVIDYQWLGVGRVRVGFNLNGQIYYAHYFSHANSVTEPYMNEPSLPVRWELKNTGTTSSNTQMASICYGVYSEGSEFETGFDVSVSSGRTAITLANSPNDVKGILAVRLKNSTNGVPMKAFAKLKEWELISSFTCAYKIMMLQTTNDITNSAGNPVTWTDVPGSNWTQYTTDFRLVTAQPVNSIVLQDAYAVGGSGTGANRTSAATDLSIDNRTASIFQNFDSTDSMIFALVAYRIGTDNAALFASMQWIEIK